LPVGIVKANYLNIERKLARALRLAGYSPRGDTVVLKPNGASAYGHYLLGDYTSPQILEAFIRLFPGRKYVIAEGSAVGMKFEDAARVNGYDRLARKYANVRLADLEHEERVELDWKFGKIVIPRIVLDNEYVNCPKMKTHNLCTVTLGMKNQKGLLASRDKKKFHRMDLHEAVRELAEVVRPDLTIVDGIIALEGNGPNSISARTRPMGLIVAGRDITEVDNACIRLMRIPPERVRHVPRADFVTAGVDIRRAAKKFRLPDTDGAGFNVGNIYCHPGCSGCLESLSGGIRGMAAPGELHRLPRRIASFVDHALAGKMYLFMGSHNTLPEGTGRMVCIGNCTKEFAREHGIRFIPGCPPDPSELTKLFD